MKAKYLWLMIVLLLVGCRSAQTTVVERIRKDTVFDIRERHDTLQIIDSVVVREWMRGDTVWIERSHRRSKERVRVVRSVPWMAAPEVVPFAMATPKEPGMGSSL